MLQAQEYHRAQFPSVLPAKGSDQNQSGHRAAGAVPRLMGQSMDPAREARHQMRKEQLEMALEVNPEAFVSVPMLYVDCELNRVPGERSAHTHSAAWIAGHSHQELVVAVCLCAVKAFVDTGAQMTVINLKCAQRCGLLQMVDPKFKGVAAGVGVARICGRVHMATLRFGKRTAVDTSLTVLEQAGGPELLIGLDLMRKYRAHIDLEKNALIIGGEELPFVQGGDKEKRR